MVLYLIQECGVNKEKDGEVNPKLKDLLEAISKVYDRYAKER